MSDDTNNAPMEPRSAQPTPPNTPPNTPPDQPPASPHVAPPEPRRDDQKYCFSCGTLVPASAAICPKCSATQPDTHQPGFGQTGPARPMPGGTSQALVAMQGASANMAYCRGCGQTIHATAPLCPHCGAPQRVQNPYGQPYGPVYGPPKSRVAAALLAIFLGGFGAHKFYLNNIGLGFVYLLFSWTFIPVIIGLIEGIILVLMSDEEFSRKYDYRPGIGSPFVA